MVVAAIFEKVGIDPLRKVYNLASLNNNATPSLDEFIQATGKKFGKLGKGGLVDVDSTCRIIIRDWNDGKIAYYTQAPVESIEEQSTIVAQWAPEFTTVAATALGDAEMDEEEAGVVDHPPRDDSEALDEE